MDGDKLERLKLIRKSGEGETAPHMSRDGFSEESEQYFSDRAASKRKEIEEGDAFLGPDGGWYEITNIASNTALSITPNYRSATNAAGVYALAPVQGYTKDLADQARAMIQQWGATLAGLGSVSTENIVPVAKGGTGGSTQAAARNGLGLGSAAVAALLGPVSQVGGVPTGAVFESGSNANGTYVKFADGTMICQ
eukprot:gene5202-7936_t